VNSPPYNTQPTYTQLVRELISDAKELLRQELALAKHEISEEAAKTKVAVIALGAGIGLAAIGGLLLIWMLVYLLNALTPLPLWACYGIIGGLFAVVGIVLIVLGKNKLSQIGVPQQTIETMKENVEWIKQKAISNKI
jgi:hypothetical protein